MRRTRFMSLLFLVWSIAFFFVPEFRQGLRVPSLGWSNNEDWEWLMRQGRLPRKVLDEAVRRGEQQREARTLAFVAQHPSSGGESLRLANEAVAIDPQYMWIFSKVFFNLDLSDRRHDKERRQLVAQLEAWDPDNAFPYFLEGTEIMAERSGNFPMPMNLDAVAKEAEWRQAMQKGYAAPRYDSYALRRFELDRSWLKEHHLDKPAAMLLILAEYPIPNLLSIRTYGTLLIRKFGKEAEDAGKAQEALSYYWTAAHLGERMQLQGKSLIEELIGAAVQLDAYPRIVPLLRKSGRNDEAAAVEYMLKQIRENVDMGRAGGPLEKSANYYWTALLLAAFAWLVIISAGITAVCMVYVNVKRWVRPEEKGRLYQVLTVAENYMPILLFLACLGLYLSYFPYAQNFHHYMTASGDIHNFEPFFYNVLPFNSYWGPPGEAELTVGNPFRPYAWYALAGLLIVVLMAIPWRRRTQ